MVGASDKLVEFLFLTSGITILPSPMPIPIFGSEPSLKLDFIAEQCLGRPFFVGRIEFSVDV